jgi:Zn-finger nucleic acid-binding protein
MKCEECGRVATTSRAVCMYCGGGLIEVVKKEISIRCPGCRGRMEKKEQGGILIDQCISCSGSWYDRKELLQLLSKTKQGLEEEDSANKLESDESKSSGVISREERAAFFKQPGSPRTASQSKGNQSFYRKCPHCESVMNRVNFLMKSGIVVDVCKLDGIFLDQGEFDSLHTFIQTRPWILDGSME